MHKGKSLNLWIDELPSKPGGLIACLGYFDCQVTREQSRLIADVIWSFKDETCTVLVSTYVVDPSRWETAQRLGWKSYVQKTFTRKSPFPKTIDYTWVVGACPSVECLQETVYTGWNLSGNESFIIMLAQDLDEVLPGIEQSYQDGLETIEANELCWVDDCPLVLSRDHDGLTLRLYTLRLSEQQLRQNLERCLLSWGITVGRSTIPL